VSGITAEGTLYALREGFSRLRRSYGLVFLVLAVNLSLAALLAVPLYGHLRSALENHEAAAANLYGFDASWWGAWRDRQSGFARELGPEIFGAGFAFRNLELLLQGRLPAGLFAWTHEGEGSRVDQGVLGLGLAYLALQTFLAGGLIGVFRASQGGWTLRGLVHGSGFYFGRLVRVALIGLVLAGLVFALNAPLARFADRQAREAVTETSALLWAFGRHLLLLLALLLVSLLSSYAKVIVVVEERSSALLAWVSAAGFCLRRAPMVLGHYLAVVLLALGVLALWTRLDALWTTTGYRSQIGALLLMEGLLLARIGLRLGLLAGQTALYRRYA
jgi:hypothetical protein